MDGGPQPIYADRRWRGDHGIGRYAREVLSRLRVPWRPLPAAGTPASPTDLLTPRMLPRGSFVYSPGYNAGLTSAIQLLTVHDLIHLSTGSARHRLYYERVVKPAIRRAGMVLTVSRTSHRAIADWLDDDRIQIVDTGNGVSRSFSAGAPSGHWGTGYMLYVGNLKPHKNVDTLLHAFRSLPDARLIAVVPDTAEFRRAAAAAGVAARTKAVAGIDDATLCDLYRGAAATVLPSLLEGFGLPAAESLRCGRPVVYWEGCESVAEIVGDHGVPVRAAREPDAWARALEAVVDVPAIDVHAVEERFSWDAVGRRVDDSVRALRAGGQP